MANEQTTGAPLTAPLREQLEAKERLDEARAAERREGETIERRVDRRKADERDAALRHAGAGQQRRRAFGRAVGEGKGHSRWPLLVGGLALFGALLALGRIRRR